MTACGYVPAQIDDLAMTDVFTLLRYWQRSPPAHELLAAVHRIEPRVAQSGDPADPSGIGDLMARYPSGRITPV